MKAGLNIASIPNNTNPSWWKDPGMRAGVFRIMILYTATRSVLMNHPAGYDLGLISASYYLPKIPLSFVIPYFCDRFGRKPAVYLGGFFMLAGAIVGGTSHSRGQLIGSRVLLGIGTAVGQVGAASLIPELAHPRIRHIIGSIFAAWLTFAMVYYPGGSSWSWRVPTLIQGFGPLLLILGTWIVPESPRWLIKNGRNEEAHEILARYHSNGKLDDPLVMMELKEIQAAIQTEELANTGSWMAYVNTPGGRRRLGVTFLIGTATQWAGNGIVSYYLVPVLKQVGISAAPQTAGINGGLAVWNFIVSLTGASLVERAGRRPLFLASLVAMLACFSVMTGVAGGYASTHHKATGVAIVPMLFLFMGSYSLSFTPLPSMYIPEISPLAMRAKGASMLILSQNVAQAFNQFVNPIALSAISWKYYIVYMAVLAAYLVLFYFFVRETRGLTTEEAAVVYDPANMREAALEAEQKLRQAAEAALEDKATASVKHLESGDSHA
ncbi:hypothetical protein MNV49_004110 [Pseudohyphozyma bogoriensis]|nr:hypothetical protein MNV49_004110 [Pseudohyphozyma bogoriensis]